MKYPVLLTAAFVFPLILVAESSLKGIVADSTGGAIAKAVIIVHWDSSGSSVGLSSNKGIAQDVIVSSGPNGEFSVPLPPGFYDIFVSAHAFSPSCTKVRLREGRDVSFFPRLIVNGLVTKELGDSVVQP